MVQKYFDKEIQLILAEISEIFTSVSPSDRRPCPQWKTVRRDAYLARLCATYEHGSSPPGQTYIRIRNTRRIQTGKNHFKKTKIFYYMSNLASYTPSAGTSMNSTPAAGSTTDVRINSSLSPKIRYQLFDLFYPISCPLIGLFHILPVAFWTPM